MPQNTLRKSLSPATISLPMARQPYMGLGLLVQSRFHGHTHLRHTTVGRTPLDEGPARRRDLYLTTHNRQTSMPPVEFEPTILVNERPKTHALDGTATGIGPCNYYLKHLYRVYTKEWCSFNWIWHWNRTILLCIPCILRTAYLTKHQIQYNYASTQFN
jgi:hypothetical protein